MAKSNWSKPEGIDGLIARKRVDRSLLISGTAIPIACRADFAHANGGQPLEQDGAKVTLLVDNHEYDAYMDIQSHLRDKSKAVRILYPRSILGAVLRRHFTLSCRLLGVNQVTGRDEPTKPTDTRSVQTNEYLDFLETGIPFRYRLRLMTTLVDDWTAALGRMHEQDLEQIIDSPQSDADFVTWLSSVVGSASVEMKERLVKVRKYRRSTIVNLRKQYGGKCQVCGWSATQEYGVDVSQGHHIEGFLTSLDNSPENLVVLCPTHHCIVHAVNAKFSREELKFVCRNGKELSLVLNKHL